MEDPDAVFNSEAATREIDLSRLELIALGY